MTEIGFNGTDESERLPRQRVPGKVSVVIEKMSQEESDEKPETISGAADVRPCEDGLRLHGGH